MKATADLRAEHGAVLRMLDIMEGFSAGLYSSGQVDQADVAQAVDFLHVFVDQCHHSKEERVLFPAMLASPTTAVQPEIQRLNEDHVKSRAAVRDIEVALEVYSPTDRESATSLAVMLDRYSSRLRDHIAYEERVYDEADAGLPPDVQRTLAEEYERIETEVIGPGRHEQFHALLDRLEGHPAAQSVA